MGFVIIEEWGDKENPFKYYTVPVFAGTFATKEEADREAQKRKPTHGGIIRAVPEKLQGEPAPKRKGRKKPPRRREK